MPHFSRHLCWRGTILLPLSHLSSNSLLHYFSIFSLLCMLKTRQYGDRQLAPKLTPIWRFSASILYNAALLNTIIFVVLSKKTAITLFIHDMEFCLVKTPLFINKKFMLDEMFCSSETLFGAFRLNISSSINLLFLKSEPPPISIYNIRF